MKKFFFAIIILFFSVFPIYGKEIDKLSLFECYELARKRNYDFKEKKLDYDIGVIEKDRAKAKFYPKLTTSTTYKSSAKVDTPMDQANSGSVSLNQPLYYSGELTYNYKSKDAAMKEKMMKLMSGDLTLRRDVFNAYITIIKVQRLIAINENAIKRVKNQLKYIEMIVEQKKRGAESVSRWKVVLNDFENELINNKNKLQDSYTNLNRLIVRDLSEKVDLYAYGTEGFFDDFFVEKEIRKNYSFNEIVDILYHYALIYNPEVHQKVENINQYLYSLRAENAGNYPKFDLTHGYSGGSNTIPSWNVGVKVSFSILDVNDWGNVKVKEKQLQKSENDRKRFLQTLKSSIRGTYSAKISALKETLNRVGQSEQAYIYLNQIIKNYNKGQATDVDLIDAFKTYYENQSFMVSSVFNYYVQENNLDALIGYNKFRQTPEFGTFIKAKDKSVFTLSKIIDEGGKIYKAINCEDFKTIKEILEKEPGLINRLSKVGWAPMHWATYRGNIEILNYIIKKGGNVNIKSQRGYTPLSLAINATGSNIVEVLIKSGADVNIASGPLKWTPLIQAAGLGDEKIVQELVDAGAYINLQSSNGWTALHSAVDIGDIEIVKILLKNGANTEIKNSLGKTPLDIARIYGMEEIEQLLLEKENKLKEDMSEKEDKKKEGETKEQDKDNKHQPGSN